jgi:hypothetical protein
MLEAVTHGALRAIKWGPGVLGTQAPLNLGGLFACALLAFALSSTPYVAAGMIALVVLYLFYANERAFRYAQKDPISALLGGSQLVQMLKHQAGAKDKNIISEQETPIVGAGAKTIEHHK